MPGLLCYEDLIEGASDEFDWPSFDENTASSLCYTSGTTGNPKGALYSHRSTVLHTYAAALPDSLNCSSRDTILPVVPMFHVNAWGLPYVACMVGAKLVFPGPWLDGKSLHDLFEGEGVTVSAGVPTVWQALLTHVESNDLSFSTMRRTIIGGSACPPAMMRAFQQRYDVQVLHAWGMTEMSPVGTVCTLKPKHLLLDAEERMAVQSKQGRAVYGVDMKIVGDDGQELPHDGKTSGELLVRGPWIIAKYFKGEGGDPLVDGWFPTGDVSTIDADGYMQITDRSKDVIKSGGEWIGSIDLENIAMAHPARGDGRLHRRAPSEVGRAAAAGGGEEARRRADARRADPFLRRQDRQVVDAGRRRLRRCDPARRHRQDAEEQAAPAVRRARVAHGPSG